MATMILQSYRTKSARRAVGVTNVQIVMLRAWKRSLSSVHSVKVPSKCQGSSYYDDQIFTLDEGTVQGSVRQLIGRQVFILHIQTMY